MQQSLLKTKKMTSHPQRKINCPTKCQQATKSSNVIPSMVLGLPNFYLKAVELWMADLIVFMLWCLLVSAGTAVGDAREDGKAAPCCACQQDCQVPLSSNREPATQPALVQEREGVQERPANWRVQGLSDTSSCVSIANMRKTLSIKVYLRGKSLKNMPRHLPTDYFLSSSSLCFESVLTSGCWSCDLCDVKKVLPQSEESKFW